MPATWGYGAAGSEPMTMAGWGYLTDLAGLLFTVALESASVLQPTITASTPTPTIVSTVSQPVITASVPTPMVTPSVSQPTVTITEKNDIS